MLYKNILVALDLKDNNKKLLDRALSLSNATQAKLYVVHVGVDVGELYSGVVIDRLDNFQTRVINDDVNLLKNFYAMVAMIRHRLLKHWRSSVTLIGKSKKSCLKNISNC
ncbi:hypothetical protein CR62_20100 [Serratia grimesii]|uniref:UspA domain-containing protein n=1 Tax=Serratia grimesii TaxID=82995 RepID=A0ABR4U4Q5_9GAMM|nr:hypothetical protein CR62_20100 [Serratia grimesii]